MKLVRILLAAPILLVVACGGAPEAARSPSSVEQERDGVPERAPATIEEAQDQIAEAQMQLSSSSSSSSNAAPADDAKATQSPAPPPPPPTSSSTGAAPKTKEEPAVDACISPCRAFASMRRAVEALCRMTGETDDRCMKARRTLDASNGRVAACRCR